VKGSEANIASSRQQNDALCTSAALTCLEYATELHFVSCEEVSLESTIEVPFSIALFPGILVAAFGFEPTTFGI